VIRALQAVMDADSHTDRTHDGRSSAQRRADALGEVCRRYLDGADRPQTGGERPHAWCDAHHVVHWADGGTTALSNLVLLCCHHHRLVHKRFQVGLGDGQPVFRKPDGTLLEDRAPP